MRVFLHTNVLISAFKWHGAPKEVYDQVLLYHDLVIGEVNLEEVEVCYVGSFRPMMMASISIS